MQTSMSDTMSLKENTEYFFKHTLGDIYTVFSFHTFLIVIFYILSLITHTGTAPQCPSDGHHSSHCPGHIRSHLLYG